jgi:hypothetical protein
MVLVVLKKKNRMENLRNERESNLLLERLWHGYNEFSRWRNNYTVRRSRAKIGFALPNYLCLLEIAKRRLLFSSLRYRFCAECV